MLSFFLIILWIGVAGSATLWGMEYYVLSLEERAFSPLAALFSPTGLIGHGYGVIGTLMLAVGVVGYSIRKRLKVLSRVGTLRSWLQVHIFLCTLGPFLVLLHNTFKFGGLVSVAFWSMTLVVASGIFGRYVYVRIPKTLNGGFLGIREARERAVELARLIRERSDLPEGRLLALVGDPAPGSGRIDRPSGPDGLLAALATAIREDLKGRSRSRVVKRTLRREGVPPTLRRDLVRLVRERDR
ncbi:MAG: hypothetical protein PVI57_19035, partial [Gemmatimonadota bacterium]